MTMELKNNMLEKDKKSKQSKGVGLQLVGYIASVLFLVILILAVYGNFTVKRACPTNPWFS